MKHKLKPLKEKEEKVCVMFQDNPNCRRPDWLYGKVSWKDVFPMDICHMLLGRPWQFERDDVHDGHANTYTLTKDGVKHKLKPLQEMNEVVFSATRVCVVDGKKFLDTMRHEDVCFVIVPKDTKT